MALPETIGTGATATIVRVSEREVLKIFKPGVKPTLIDREFDVATFAYQHGISTAEPIGQETYEDRPSTRFSFVPGTRFDMLLSRRFWSYRSLIEKFAQQQRHVHQTNASSLPQHLSQKTLLRFFIAQSGRLGEHAARVLAMLDKLPEGDSLCHGDYSFGNIIVDRGRLSVVDWMTGAFGDPAADVANTWLGLGELVPRSSLPKPVKWGLRLASRGYRDAWRGDEAFLNRVEDWLLPVAAAKLGAQEMCGVREELLATLTDFIAERVDQPQ